MPGFGVRANASGRPAFVVKYRVKGDPRQTLFTLGEWPTASPDAMRGRAAAIKSAARLGLLVGQERAQV